MKNLKIVMGILAMHIILYTLWTVAFLGVFYFSESQGKSGLWEGMLEKSSTVSVQTGTDGKSVDAMLGQLAELENARLVLVGRDGIKKWFGNGAETFAAEIKQPDIQQVLAGEVERDFKRKNPIEVGHATTGQPVSIEGQTYALFTEILTPDPFHGYGKQIGTLFITSCLIFLIASIFSRGKSRPHHIFTIMIDAMRRMAKGDFNVTVENAGQYKGEFGKLVVGLNQMAVELNQMEQMRQEFISNVSHEIQSPLTSISGFSRALQNEELSTEERNHYLEIIETESIRLSKLSDNLLKLTSLESTQHPFDPKAYRLDKQLRKVVLACEPQWVEKGIEMDIDLDNVEIVADEDMMNQVWVNLIHNSIKFTPSGGTIHIELQMQANEVRVRISDTGDGIEQEALAHIFDRFYKADKSRHRTGSGSGLGLSIVKKIVELHGGTIEATSRLGEGTEFAIALPKLGLK